MQSFSLSYRILFLLVLIFPMNILAGTLDPPVPCSGCWIPPVQTSWQWQLSGTVNQENWRTDAHQFPPQVIGNAYDGWPGEWWLDIRRIDLLGPIMQARMDLCKSKGFDGIEFDNVDACTADTGFPLTYNDQLVYNVWPANQAHLRGLNVALKNESGQVQDLLPYFDWALAEECFRYKECDMYIPFINAEKAVMDTEYRGKKSKFCPTLNGLNINGIRKRLDLDAWRKSCR